MRNSRTLPALLIFGLALTLPTALFADEAQKAAAPKMESADNGYLKSFSADFEAVNQKLMALGEAIPTDKFTWRPTEKVRSVSEVFIHVTTTNYFLAYTLGVQLPEGMTFQTLQGMEKKVTSKSAVLEAYRLSLEQVRAAAEKAAGEDLNEEVEIFGGKRPRRGVFFLFSGHAHEHLGQAIAYARMADVVPPWSR